MKMRLSRCCFVVGVEDDADGCEVRRERKSDPADVKTEWLELGR